MTEQPIPVTAPIPPLDDVMLAMDVVDTLRHRDKLIQQELEAEGQDHALVAHIQHLYASQGMEVSERVVADAIRALREDRFVYKRPRRTLAIRVAELYVDRGWWARRVVVSVALLIVVLVSWQAGPTALQRWRAQTAARDLGDVTTLRADLEGRARTLAANLEREARGVPELVQQPASRLIGEARSELARAATALDAELLARSDHGERPGIAVLREASRRGHEALDQARRELDAAQGAVTRLVDLDRIAITADSERQSLLTPAQDAAREEAARRWDRVRASLDRADPSAASAALEDLRALRDELALTYDLRIVSRPGEPTGVWRRPRSNPGGRSYYIVVEPVVAGRVLELPVLSEETHVIKRVHRFGVRVPPEVYESIRADKADDGLVRDDRFGEKRAGELTPHYRHPVVGGFITEW